MLSQSLRRWRAYLFGDQHNSDQARVIVLGLDAAGKTTFLYKARALCRSMFLPDLVVVTAIPTIGFNVESMEFSNVNLTCWDIGGCDKIRPLWRHYTTGAIAFVLFVDSNDRERIPDAKHELDLFMTDETLQGVPLLVVANKQDLPNALTPMEVADRLGLQQLRGRDWFILPASVAEGIGVAEVISWINKVKGEARASRSVLAAASLTTNHSNSPAPPQPEMKPAGNLINSKSNTVPLAHSIPPPVPGPSISNLSWAERPDVPEDEFLNLLSSYQLDIWDHYTHVRIAWVLINKHGLREGFERVEAAIRGFIENSPRTDARSFHATMTRFWCHMIAYARERVNHQVYPDHAQAVGWKEFITVVCDTHVTGSVSQQVPLYEKTLFKRYYSNSAMFRTEARSHLQPPDVLALPDIIPLLRAPESEQQGRDVAFLQNDAYWKLQNLSGA